MVARTDPAKRGCQAGQRPQGAPHAPVDQQHQQHEEQAKQRQRVDRLLPHLADLVGGIGMQHEDQRIAVGRQFQHSVSHRHLERMTQKRRDRPLGHPEA